MTMTSAQSLSHLFQYKLDLVTRKIRPSNKYYLSPFLDCVLQTMTAYRIDDKCQYYYLLLNNLSSFFVQGLINIWTAIHILNLG